MLGNLEPRLIESARAAIDAVFVSGILLAMGSLR